jgi:SAM-dependent methyltransferase
MRIAQEIQFVCPRCHGELDHRTEGHMCTACAAVYPVVSGIPDFRVAPDPWIDVEQDRAKARRIDAETAGLPFEDTVRAYWRMTPETPDWLADRYVDHVTWAATRSREWLSLVTGRARDDGEGTWLELGCGTGDLVAAANGQHAPIIGIDIALRWLVIARKRQELGEEARLICCCAEHLPFPPGSFSRVLSLGLLEHCTDPLSVMREAARVLQGDGDTHLRTTNRYTLLREPHVLVWGVGYVPRRYADAYVRLVSGRRYLHHRPLSSRELAKALESAGFVSTHVRAASLLPAERARLGRAGVVLAGPYEALRRAPVGGRALTWVAPLLEADGRAA